MRFSLMCAAIAAFASVPATAGASQLIDRDASDVRLAVNARGEALLTYRARGRVRRVLAWGALNAIAPTPDRPQIAFRLDYSGRRAFANACLPYDGPPLAWLVRACKAPDGSYWAVQSWQRRLPNVGLTPTPEQAAWELRLSHWRGELPVLTIRVDIGRYTRLFGSVTYLGKPVHGFRSTAQGAPLDTYGRNIYLDTFNSAYGAGWRRENSFLARMPDGSFRYGLFPGQNGSAQPSGQGQAYRATVIGPGVTPDVMWQSAPASV